MVVAGGAGFIGSHLSERLLARGDQVVCIDNFATGHRDNLHRLSGDPSFELIEHDVTEPITVSGRVDFVINLASAASPVQYARLPLETLRAGAFGTQHCLDLAREHGARFILASSSEVYGDPHEHPQREDYWGHVNPVGPRSVYDEAKRYAEALTSASRRALGTDVGIARLFNCYGPRLRVDDGRAIPSFISQALAGRPITVSGDGGQTRAVCFVDDIVSGLLALADSDLMDPVNLGNPEEITILALAEQVRAMTDSSSPIAFVPRPVDDPSLRCPDISLASERLDWRPTVNLTDGLERTIAWFREAYGAPATAGHGSVRSHEL